MSSFAPSAAKLPDNGFAYVTKAKKKRKGNAKRLVPGPRLDFQAELELTRQEFQSSEEWAGFRAPFISSTPFPPDSFRVSETAFAGMSFQFVNFDISPPTFPESADLQLGRFSPSRKKKQRHTKNAWTPRPVLLPTDDKFWNLPEEDSSLAQDLEVL
ncbi:hypothetical protein FRC05_000370 [Tulasnella sp. 425]|nr:hypothetical protein FRC05_000370 [Tulasnella sp. 425]